jgi:hypothetical protein
MRLFVLLAAAAAVASAQAALARPAPVTQLPPIAAKKLTCPKRLYDFNVYYPVTTMVAAEKGRHPSAILLTCQTAGAIALAGKSHFLKLPVRTGVKITVAGAVYTLGTGGPSILPATSGPVYGWFGNGIEVLLIVPSGR